MLLASVGILATLAGAAALYRASPHHQLPGLPGPARAWLWAGGALMALGLACLLGWAGPATAVFMALTGAMLVWSFLPPCAAWLAHRGENRR
ncbi:hypothetical protein MTR62_05030 [Novosphingobium sp. 1949]|uniref:DUF3325 domain-containing protein n=1 Tax=Novosphingobium organovorum TaxID=2930092 RepID=A0ABT0BAL1_9SPHN|nr:hypothetical protein [Novosphingobium organovorum]MCJ2182068.1 hypothetical protein [Novosphingobium organovorum]